MRHGPHHSAKKSTSTGLSAVTNSLKFAIYLITRNVRQGLLLTFDDLVGFLPWTSVVGFDTVVLQY